MVGILYFSSTGNSLYIAQRINKATGGKIIYIPKYEGIGEEFEKIIIVSPIYSFGLPCDVYDLLPKLNKDKPIHIVLNYGGMVGGADYFTYCYAKENGLNIQSVHIVKMPENYTLTFTVPSFYVKSTLKSAPKAIDKIAQSIQDNEVVIPKQKKTKKDTYIKNKGNWHLIADDFSVTDSCVLCKKCIDVCPSGNISIKDNKIVFADKCVACLGCYHRCPQKAIIYKGRIKKNRYINPNINENDIGKDL
jgi:ferredoxin